MDDRLRNQLEDILKEAEVEKVCDKASDRGVAPVVIQAARQVLMEAEMDAPETIQLESPDGEVTVNYFGAVAQILELVPGRMGELTYDGKGEGEKPPEEPVSVNEYDNDEEMTLEEAEELAKKRREELGIKKANSEPEL